MEFLHLTSDTVNFNFDGKTLKWELPNLQFFQSSKIAISEVLIVFKKRRKEKFIYLTTNLISAGENNSDGVVMAKGIDGFKVEYIASNLNFWPIDYQRPRTVEFTINGLDSSDFDFISILVCINNAAGVMVRV
jgi:hypothetical protein